MPASQGIVDKNPANDTMGHHVRSFSTFDKSLSYRNYNTHRFGEYTPTFVMDGVPKDEISLNSSDDIDSLSLKAPFKGSMRKVKESFMVPNMAILPMQWDRIYAQNSNGDDVPLDANCILQNFPTSFKNLFTSVCNAVLNLPLTTDAEVAAFLTAQMRLLVLGEYIYSNGSLLNSLGYKASTQISVNQLDSQANRLYTINYDQWFDKVIETIFEELNSFEVIEPVGSGTVTHRFVGLNGIGQSDYLEGWEQFRYMVELFRENPLCYFNTASSSINYASSRSAFAGVITANATAYGVLNYPSIFTWHLPTASYSGADPLGGNTADPTTLNPNLLNLTRILSYQLVCAHFYSNSSIDFIYSAELYREYIKYFVNALSTAISNYTNVCQFTWNGLSLQYDYLSGHLLHYCLLIQPPTTIANITSIISALCSNIGSASHYTLNVFAVYSAIFGYRKSLRYGDYFTASRPRPLAPINTDVSVASNAVSVIDITRNIQAQRFANAVMRSRSKIEEYVKGLFGKAPQPDYHNPFFLTRQEEFIFGDQVQNTAENTNVSLPQSRTSNWSTRQGRYTFTFHNEDMHPCTYLQIVSYDSPRAYSRSVERQFLVADRFDMFNPDFQFIGDQPIYGIELGYYSYTGIPNIFAYTTRDMEYKQRFDQCSGGFSSGSLPGWAFTDNKLNSLFYGRQSLNPDFIRSRNSDIDYLYLSLTGFSLGTYFHFTCVTDNNVRAKRAMAVDPQILA